MKRITMTLAVGALFIISAWGQGFQNLNFESATNLPGGPPIPDGVDVAATNALPGWTAYAGGSALAEINYVSNYFGGVSTSVELEGGSLALSGNNLSVGLYGFASISQTGLVPEDTESLQFEAQGPGPDDSLGASGLEVTLGGQTLSYSALSEGPDYWVYGANIPADTEGQTEALIFLIQLGQSGGVLLDDIDFSTSPIPEPSECALIGLGSVLFGLRRRRER
jgi:hypothetical protein